MLTAEEIVTADNDNKNDSNASHSNEGLIPSLEWNLHTANKVSTIKNAKFTNNDKPFSEDLG